MQYTNTRSSANGAIFSKTELDLQIAEARRAQSEDLHRMVVDMASAIDRLFLHRAPAAG